MGNGTGQWPAQQHPDYWLVQEYLKGDQDIWDLLYQRAYPVAKGYLKRQNSMQYLSPSDGEDILSEAFLRCQRLADSFEGRSSFSRWVCGFVRYIALDAVKKRIHEDRRSFAWKDILYPSVTYATPETQLLLQERNRYLWFAYGLLPEYHQVLIGYFVLGSNTYREARRITGLRRKADMRAELDSSLAVFKKFYLRLYGK